LAIAVNPKFNYVRVQVEQNVFVVSQQRVVEIAKILD
jgi:isoleucyl-tRNA synthetase